MDILPKLRINFVCMLNLFLCLLLCILLTCCAGIGINCGSGTEDDFSTPQQKVLGESSLSQPAEIKDSNNKIIKKITSENDYHLTVNETQNF